mmetsp:Transcript_58880/g.155874  ORF Transcript_58880/g.155874 Transcript_58880/m.155874 type:complete len:224 (-) Transcript_58880:677-1348(-)
MIASIARARDRVICTLRGTASRCVGMPIANSAIDAIVAVLIGSSDAFKAFAILHDKTSVADTRTGTGGSRGRPAVCCACLTLATILKGPLRTWLTPQSTCETVSSVPSITMAGDTVEQTPSSAAAQSSRANVTSLTRSTRTIAIKIVRRTYAPRSVPHSVRIGAMRGRRRVYSARQQRSGPLGSRLRGSGGHSNRRRGCGKRSSGCERTTLCRRHGERNNYSI